MATIKKDTAAVISRYESAKAMVHIKDLDQHLAHSIRKITSVLPLS
jgi:hypothetical protein